MRVDGFGGIALPGGIGNRGNRIHRICLHRRAATGLVTDTGAVVQGLVDAAVIGDDYVFMVACVLPMCAARSGAPFIATHIAAGGRDA